MAFIKSEDISLAPTTSGALVVNSSNTYNGYLHAVQFIVSTSLTSTGGLLEVKGERTNIPLFTKADLSSGGAAGVYLPRLNTVLSTDAATLSTGLGWDKLPLFNERLVVTVTSGSTGGAKAATLRVFVE